MKFATFVVETALGTHMRVGVVDGHALLDVTAGYGRVLADDGAARATERARAVAPPDMLEFVRGGDAALDAATAVLDAGYERDVRGPDGARVRYEREAVDVRSPLPRPNSIRDFSVFEDHAADEEKPDVWYDIPCYYKGNPDSVVGPERDVAWPAWEDSLDFELEVAAIVGTPGRDIDPDDALSHVFGFTVYNDFSARDYQFYEMEMPFGPAKGKDFANTLGPVVVTPDEFDADGAEVRALVNGEEWGTGSLADMYHSWGDMLAHASMGETLQPGDVLGSGTAPGCCGLDLDRWLEPGDTVTLDVDGIGTLSNRVVRDS